MAKKASKKVSKKEEQMSEITEKTVLVLLVIIIILLAVILGIVILKKNNNISNDSNYKVNVDDNDDGIKVTDEIIDNQTTTNDKNYIGRDNAISIALKDLKLTKKDVYDLECELDKEFNQTVYEVTFNYKNLEYEYYINPETGKIIHSFKELD